MVRNKQSGRFAIQYVIQVLLAITLDSGRKFPHFPSNAVHSSQLNMETLFKINYSGQVML